MDPVNHKALKGKFKDREDKDIDNNGKVDSSDEYLHKRRQAVSKAIGKIKEAAETLDEVSTEKLRDYASAALQDKNKAKADKRWKYAGKAMQTVADRDVKAAHDRKYNKMEEEVEQIDETSLYDKIKAARANPSPDKPVKGRGSKNHNPKTYDPRKALDKEDDRIQTTVKKNLKKESVELDEKRGLWDNIHAKRKRIEAGSGEKMRKPGSKGAPTDADFKNASESTDIGEAKTDVYHKHMLKALGKSRLPKDHSYTSAIANNGDFVVKDGGGRTVGRIPKGEHNLSEVTISPLQKIRMDKEKADRNKDDNSKTQAKRITDKQYAGYKVKMKEAKDGDGANIVRDKEFKGKSSKTIPHAKPGEPGHNTHASMFKKDGPKPAWMDRAAKMRKEEVEKKSEELPADKKPLRMKMAHFRNQE